MTAPYAPEPLPDAYLLRKYVELEEQFPDIDEAAEYAEYEEIIDLIVGDTPDTLGISF